MARISNDSKHARKERVWLCVKRHPHGITELEIANYAGMERRTVNNYLTELETEGKIYKDSTLWLPLDYDGTRLRSFDLQPEEAIALYLGARLLVKQSDKRNEPAETALLKLAEALTTQAGVGNEIAQAAHELAGRPVREGYQPIFLTVVRGYLYRRQIALRYHPLNARPFETRFSTYLIEPSPVGLSTYLIGHSQAAGALRSYKLERIEEARLTADPYTIPPDFPGLEVLKHAWSIIFGEEPRKIVLRFSPQVSRRVLETIWHPSQQTTPDPDRPGWLRWSAAVADTMDMIPWIRGWGSQCEVLEPEDLRNTLKQEARQLGQLYQIGTVLETEVRYYAHSKEGVDRSDWQRLIDHLNNTANLAFELGQDAGISELARIAGLLHDIGKYSYAFQRRLEGAKHRVDHATAGAREITQLFQNAPQKGFANLLAYCIAGHHGGLPDFGSVLDVGGEGTLSVRLDPAKTKLPDYSAYRTEIDIKALTFQPRMIKPIKGHQGFSASFLTRMLFSTLVDADWLETETYMDGGQKPRGGYESITALCQKFSQFLEKFDHPENAINQKRTETLKACLTKATHPQGIFTLTIPTGGGKTLASMAFALNHAVTHGLKRIIYVIPFTSIIEQNAAVFKDALGEYNVLEHHSNFDWEQKRESFDDQTNNVMDKLKLAAENWDIPIVVTTNVQFFESLFASKKSHCRKLHNIARSVIIFDEAQMLPREYLQPCMFAVQELVQNYGASAIFCTATQPLLKKFMPDLPEFTELTPNPQALFDFYKRVQVKNEGNLPDEQLLERMNAQSQALCIVNTRKHAKGLFDGLAEEGRFHLSTLMCAAHRKQTLLTIRDRLKNGEICRVVSTQVMEAGIDIDFPVGYRAMAGLDSILQAAGRVNREGKRAGGEMFVFEPESEFIKRTPTYIKQTADVARNILRDFANDPTSMQAIRAYFQMLMILGDDHVFDAKEILPCLDRTDGFDFKTAAEKFKLINDATVAVIIPYNEEALKWVEELRYTRYPASTLRKLQSYTVNIYEQEFQGLNVQGVIEMAADAYPVLKDMHYYDLQTGIVLPARDGGAAIFFD